MLNSSGAQGLNKTQNTACEELVQQYSSVGDAQKQACWASGKAMRRTTRQGSAAGYHFPVPKCVSSGSREPDDSLIQHLVPGVHS